MCHLSVPLASVIAERETQRFGFHHVGKNAPHRTPIMM